MKNIRLEKVVLYGLLGLVVWLPIPDGSNRSWAWMVMEIWVFSLMIMWCLSWLRGEVHSLNILVESRTIVYLFAIWLIYVALQLVPLPLSVISILSPERAKILSTNAMINNFQYITQDYNSTLVFMFKSISYFFLFLLILLVFNTRKRLEILAKVIVFSALFQAVYGGLMTLSGIEYNLFAKKIYGIGNATGTFVNRNHFAGFLEMSLAIGIGLMISSLGRVHSNRNYRQKIRWLIRVLFSSKFRLRTYLALMVVALVLTHSRMGNVAFFISLTVVGIIVSFSVKGKRQNLAIFLVSIIAIDVVIVGAWFGLDKVANRIENTHIVKEQRFDVNENTYSYIKDYLLLGSGGGTFYAIFPIYRSSDVIKYFDHAHNDYLEFVAEVGLVGFVILACIVLISIYKSLKIIFHSNDMFMIGMSFASLMGVLAILIHSLVDFNLQIPSNSVLFIILIAVPYLLNQLRRADDELYYKNLAFKP